MLTSLKILPVTVISLERFLCPIKQGLGFDEMHVSKSVSRELPGELTINQSNRFSLCAVHCD